MLFRAQNKRADEPREGKGKKENWGRKPRIGFSICGTRHRHRPKAARLRANHHRSGFGSKRNRLRRWPLPEVLHILKQSRLSVAPGVVEAAPGGDHIRTLRRIRLVSSMLKAAKPQVGTSSALSHPVRGEQSGQAIRGMRDVVNPVVHARARKDHAFAVLLAGCLGSLYRTPVEIITPCAGLSGVPR